MFGSTVLEIQEDVLTVATPSGNEHLQNDFTFVLIGFRPDVDLLSRFGIQFDGEMLAPFHDAETFETAIPGLYVAGSVVAGKNNNSIFVENGRFHGNSIVRSILSRRE